MNEGYKMDWFLVKYIGGYMFVYLKTKSKMVNTDEESYRDFLKKIVLLGRSDKNHNLVFESPINKYFLEIAGKENASTSI